MDFTSAKNASENNNNNNNSENSHQIADSSPQLASDSHNIKETEERQSRELKAGLHPLKVLRKHFKNLISVSYVYNSLFVRSILMHSAIYLVSVFYL